MTFQNRLANTPILLALCIGAIWVACSAAILPLHPSASRTGAIFRLETFVGPALSLVFRLQTEKARLATAVASGAGALDDLSLQSAYAGTDQYHDIFLKVWGRFNSAEFGEDFTRQAETAIASLEKIKAFRADAAHGSFSVMRVSAFYSEIISQLAPLVSQITAPALLETNAGKQQLALAESINGYVAAASDMDNGLAALSGESLTAQQLKKWNANNEGLGSILSRSGHLAQNDSSVAIAPPEALSSVVKAAAASERFQADAAAGRLSAFPSRAEWLNLQIASQERLLQVAGSHHWQLADSVKTTGVDHILYFIVSILIACAATAGLIYAFKPEYLWHTLAALVLVFNVLALAWVFYAGGDLLSDETGPLELLQSVVLAAAFCLMAVQALTGSGLLRTAATALAMATFIAFYRELDFRDYDVPEIVITLTSGPGRRVLIGAIALVLLGYLAAHFRQLKNLASRTMAWKAWPLLLSPVTLIFGEYVESLAHATQKDVLHGYWANGQTWEELLELNAYIALLYAACILAEIYGERANAPAGERNTAADQERSARMVAKP